MTHLEELTSESRPEGLGANGALTTRPAEWRASKAVMLADRDDAGRVDQDIIYRDDEMRLRTQSVGRPWSFKAAVGVLRLASEARRTHLAWMIGPFLAVQTSTRDSLPDQLDAMRGRILDRHQWRFRPADDPPLGESHFASVAQTLDRDNLVERGKAPT